MIVVVVVLQETFISRRMRDVVLEENDNLLFSLLPLEPNEFLHNRKLLSFQSHATQNHYDVYFTIQTSKMLLLQENKDLKRQMS